MNKEKKIRLAFLCGKGAGDYLALEKARHAGLVDFEIGAMIAVSSLSRAVPVYMENHGQQPFIIQGWKNEREACWHELRKILEQHQFDYLLLCGFPFLIPADIVEHFAGKIVNSHHSQLPLYPGLFKKEILLASALKFIGATLHIVDEGMDTGPILAQAIFPNPGPEHLEQALKTYRFAQDCLVVQWLRNAGQGDSSKATSSGSGEVMFVPGVDDDIQHLFISGKEDAE